MLKLIYRQTPWNLLNALSACPDELASSSLLLAEILNFGLDLWHRNRGTGVISYTNLSDTWVTYYVYITDHFSYFLKQRLNFSRYIDYVVNDNWLEKDGRVFEKIDAIFFSRMQVPSRRTRWHHGSIGNKCTCTPCLYFSKKLANFFLSRKISNTLLLIWIYNLNAHL